MRYENAAVRIAIERHTSGSSDPQHFVAKMPGVQCAAVEIDVAAVGFTTDLMHFRSEPSEELSGEMRCGSIGAVHDQGHAIETS